MTQTRTSAPLSESEDPEPVSLRFRFDSETVEQFAERYSSDVSRGGIFVHSRQPFPVGTQLKLNLQLLDGSPLIVGEGTVFWTREPDANKPQTVPGMGVRFSKLTGHSQRVIELVLSQRTGRERSGLFPTINASMVIEESGRHPTINNRSKLPFNVFPGSRPAGASGDGSRELLATAGREEATPLVGVSAATLADARPGKDEPSSKTPAPAPAAKAPAPAKVSADGGSGAHALSPISKRNAPALALIKPGTAEHKVADAGGVKIASIGDSGKVTASGRHRAPTPAPALTSTQEIASPLGATPPVPVQGERVLEASQAGIAAASVSMSVSTASRSSKRNKMIVGAAALLAVTITIFATTRGGPSSTAARGGARTTIAGAPSAPRTGAPDPSGRVVEPTTVAHAPGGSVAEASSPALEPEPPASASSSKPSGSASSSGSSRIADRRAPKGKPANAHRPNETASAARPSAPAERPPVVEAPSRVESPAPSSPAAIGRAEPPAAPPPIVRAEPPAAPRITATAPPPVATMSHKLRLTSIPSEADVELDGKVIGKTPLFGVEVEVTRPHALLVRKDGFAPFKQTIGAGSEWSIRSTENTATLRIQAFMKKN